MTKAEKLAVAPTHQVVDFGPGPEDQTLGYPFEGTEQECFDWLDDHQEMNLGRFRYGMQLIPESDK